MAMRVTNRSGAEETSPAPPSKQMNPDPCYRYRVLIFPQVEAWVGVGPEISSKNASS